MGIKGLGCVGLHRRWKRNVLHRNSTPVMKGIQSMDCLSTDGKSYKESKGERRYDHLYSCNVVVGSSLYVTYDIFFHHM